MTDFYSFINSKDVEKYYREIKHEFSPLEAAWVVYQSKFATLREKFNAWEDIINSMPDCEVPERRNCKYRESLHDTLRKYMNLLERNLNVFRSDNNGGVYRYAIHWKDQDTWSKDDDLYTSEQACIEDIREDLEDIEKFKIERVSPDKGYTKIVVHYNSREEVTDVDPITNTDEESELNSLFFEGLWFQFPAPFKKGDIVIDPYVSAFTSGSFVLDGLTAWDEYVRESVRENGDYTDMGAWGYFQNEDGTIYHECTCNYLNLEYYRGPFDGVKRFLIALSNYKQNRIDVGLLLLAYHKVVFDYAANHTMLYHWYTEEGLKLAGLEDVIKDREKPYSDSGLNPKVVFDKYKWDKNPELRSKCMKIASNYDQPKEQLFLYGKHGCGKTTLLECLGNMAKRLSNRDLRYITGANFIYYYKTAIKEGKFDELRERYRNLDVLILDDIQRLEGEECITTEITDIINDLVAMGKQIVVSSSKPLDELNISDELKSKLSFFTQIEMK